VCGKSLGLKRLVTIRVSRRLDERLKAVEVDGAGGCPTCRDGEARAFLALLRRLAEEAEHRR
jgi:hypothetical protein